MPAGCLGAGDSDIDRLLQQRGIWLHIVSKDKEYLREEKIHSDTCNWLYICAIWIFSTKMRLSLFKKGAGGFFRYWMTESESLCIHMYPTIPG